MGKPMNNQEVDAEISQETSQENNQDDSIYGILRSDILNLRLRPGMMISIKDISETYGAGRSPVRDALIQLSKEKLITFLPQRGTMISKISQERAESARFLRNCVEEQVMLECMASCNLKAITELELSLSRQTAILKSEDVRAFLDEDEYFHSIFYEGAGRSYCDQVLTANSGDYRRIRLLSLTEMGITESIIKQHKDLVDSLTSRDADRMHAVFTHHINRLISQERMLAERYPELFDEGKEEARREPDGLNVDFLINTKLRYQT